MLAATEQRQGAETAVPLVVDLDGTLIRTDLLAETIFAALGANPFCLFDLIKGWRRGRSHLKAIAAELSAIDPASLPYDADVLSLIDKARAQGRPVYLASASTDCLVAAVARHIGKFDGWFASKGDHNLKAQAKAQLLVAKFGEKGFDYAGNEAADLPIWAHARKAIAVATPAHVQARLSGLNTNSERIGEARGTWRAWLKLLRVHQYAKNLLVFIPLVAAHAFTTPAIFHAVLAFIAFSACASGVYILNDAADLSADRMHPTKRDRPLAKGTIPIWQALAAVPGLLLFAFAVAALTNWDFVLILAGYLAVTTAYTFKFKRMLLLDAVSLAGLYTLRVIGGAAAVSVPVSSWLLGFSLFIFTSLALVKRYVELTKLLDQGLPNPANRAYEKDDLPIVASLAAAAGYNAVIVLALYISSDTVTSLYGRPQMLWLVCPLVMYWISRLIMKAHRRQMDDDPVVFALKDPISLITALCITIAGLLAL